MHAAKHFDPQLGIDIHLYALPPVPPIPCPLPTPHLSIVFDPFDYIPIIGGTVQVQGVKRATAGTQGIAIHIPLGVYHPTMLPMLTGPQKDNELFMGSMTVVADGDPLSRITMPVLDCNMVGIVFPFRKKKPSIPQRAMVLPTALNLAIPNSVNVGGPPMISIMGMAFKGLFKGLGKLRKSKLGKFVGEKFKSAKRRVFKNMDSGFLKCKVLRAEPVDIRTGAVEVTHEDFSIPGRLPLVWTRRYRSDALTAGVCGIGWQTPLDARLEVDAEGGVLFRGPDGALALFERLPQSLWDDIQRDPLDGARLSLANGEQGRELYMRTAEGLIYVFEAPATVKPGVTLIVQRLQDRHGNHWRFERTQGLLTRIVESGLEGLQGRFIGVSQQGGRIHHLVLHDPATGTTHLLVRYRYGESGDLIAAHDALDAARSFAYDAQHRLLRHTDRVGLSFHYSYDAQSRVVHAWGDGGLYDYRFVYDALLNETRVTDSLGHTSLVKFDGDGLPLCEIDPHDGCTFFEYDDWGRTVAVTDPAGLRTAFDYDAHGNLTQLTRPDGSTVQTEYSEDDEVIALVDPAGGRWTQRWDTKGQLIEQTTPLGATSRYGYDAHGQLIRHTNARGAETTLCFDRHGQLATLTDAHQHATRFEHDGLGRLLRRTDASGHGSAYRYDAKGRLIAATMPGDACIACEYDAEDQLIRYRDENGGETRLEYTGIGQLARRRQPDGQSVRYEYDTEEQLTAVINQRNERYGLARDALGRIVTETDYWGQPRQYAYDAAGRLRTSTDPLGRRVGFATDALGRIVRKTFEDIADPTRQTVETFRYDLSGQLVELQNAHAHVARKFDAEGRLIEETQNGFKVENAYDAAGNRIERKTGAGNIVRIDYDLLDAPSRIAINDEAPITIERDALGRAVTEQLSPQLKRSFTYTDEGLLASQKVERDHAPLFDTKWDYDKAGNLTERKDSDFGVDRYRYDPMGRVLEHIDPTGKLTPWLNDPAGDRLQTQVREAQRRQVVGGADQVEWTREGGYDGINYVFDRAGNLTCRTHHNEPQQPQLHLRWDANQRLHQSQWQGGYKDGQTTTYGYDPLGRRVFKKNPNDVTRFFWDGDALLAEVTSANEGLVQGGAEGKVVDFQAARAKAEAAKALHQKAREYVYNPGSFEPLAMIDAAAPSESTKPVYHYSNDPNGCPTRLTTSRGELKWSARYTAWGKAAEIKADTLTQPIRLQGQYEDSETRLLYNRFRYYDHTAGIFISLDPIGLAGGTNNHEFAPNSLTWIDPLGLRCWSASRKAFWKAEAKGAARGRYSAANMRRMAEGKAPKFKAWVVSRKTGARTLKDVSMELHHYRDGWGQKARRLGANLPWNLKKVTPWEHEAEDEFRHVGSDLDEITQGLHDWTP